ncbi:hypothetical protein ED733_002192 [Metarhizium rileyi]|uniref:Uncharacterized protein n=1 Tax=Metarhizium rileyi (strain RCEF 4871) TaxID=1649241 RepID=A0A5C6G0H1_METRR|nr:hypothetical protein ED733_002192 [Metarhizium rileyi]
MDEELDSEDPAFDQLIKHIDNLAPDIYAIYVSPNGHLISTCTNLKDDETRCVYRTSLDSIQRPENVKVVSRLQLEELDRWGPNVDLVICLQSGEPTKEMNSKDDLLGLPPYIPGGTLEENETQIFKLNGVIDTLNLDLRVVH